MFYRYVRFIARCATGLEQRYPRLPQRGPYYYTKDYYKFEIVSAILLAVCFFIPAATLLWIVFSLRISDKLKLLILAILCVLFFAAIIRTTVRELKKK